jgi:hypothetical protein
MRVALGLKAHSGWAALVVIGCRGDALQVVERRRIELIAKGGSWAKQPYHAAKRSKAGDAGAVVRRASASARRLAVREVRAAVRCARAAGHEVAACAVLAGNPMPRWTVAEILAVHFRMHKAEGVLFRSALARAARSCRLELFEIPEKELGQYAERALAKPPGSLRRAITSLGRSVGTPWGKDQKDASLAAVIALRATVG